MSQADNVVTFPIDAGTTEFLRDFIGTPEQRLDAVATRLCGLEALLFFAKNSDGLPQLVATMLDGIETMVRDCIAVADLRPVQVVA